MAQQADAAADTPPKREKRQGALTPPGMREEAWAKATLDARASKIAALSEGNGGNRALYNAAVRMGTMVARGWIVRRDVEDRLIDAAHTCGIVARQKLRGAEKRGIAESW